MKNLVKAVLKIAKRKPNGFTLNAFDLSEIKYGWAIGMEETQNCFGFEGCEKALRLAQETTGVIGGWKNGKLFYFDAIIIESNPREAIRLGIENGQIVIYNLETAEFIWL